MMTKIFWCGEYIEVDDIDDDEEEKENPPIFEYRNGFEFRKYPHEKVWSVDDPSTRGQVGEMLYSFDGETVFNFFRDFHKLTEEQKKIFAEYNPTLAALKGY